MASGYILLGRNLILTGMTVPTTPIEVEASKMGPQSCAKGRRPHDFPYKYLAPGSHSQVGYLMLLDPMLKSGT